MGSPLKILPMPHITLKKCFKEVLDNLQGENLFLGLEEALLLVRGEEGTYPIILLPRGENTFLRLDKGAHFLDLGEVHVILNRLAQKVGGEVIHSTLDPKARPKTPPTTYATPRRWLEGGGLGRLLKDHERVDVEIGFGNGEFLERLVEQGKAVVGIEISNWAIKRALNRLRGKGPHIILKAPGGWAVKWLFPPESIDALYILFPFPWPKRPSRRLIQAPFVQTLAEKLRRGGRVILATDHEEYAQQMRILFSASPCFQEGESPEEIDTKYLRKWISMGLAIHKMAFIKRETPSAMDHRFPYLQYLVKARVNNPQEVMEAFQPWTLRPEGQSFFKVERIYLNLKKGTLLFRTTFQDPDLSLHHQFLMWKEGILDLAPTWGETVPPPLARAMESMGKWLAGL